MNSSFSVVGSTEDPAQNKTAFPVEGLHVPGSSLEALRHIEKNIPLRIPEAGIVCNGLLSRLQQVHGVVVELDPDDPSKVAYNNVLVRFLRLQIQRPVLVRLAKSDTTLRVLRELHQRLDGIFERFSVEDTSDWEAPWEAGCDQQRQELTKLAARPPFFLANEVGDGKKLREALQTLRGAVNKDREGGEMRDLRQRTLDRVTSAKRIMNLNIYEWFIAIEDVDYEDEALGRPGTFALAHRASWLNEGKRQDVVVKTLHYITSDIDSEEDAFLQQLVLWYNLPPHENLLKLHGGNHERSHPFFVCEDAHNGNLVEFFQIKEHKKFFWQVFLGVANGLKFLHEHNIVHRSLKGNNILIGDGNIAKIGDFGFSQVRGLSMNLSETGARATSDAIRWQPKELLQGSLMRGALFASDIYSLGLCMMEAISGEIPYGVEDDVVVLPLILAGNLPDRPDAASGTAWDLICSLCAADYRARPNIDEVISTLRSLVEKETTSSSAHAA